MYQALLLACVFAAVVQLGVVAARSQSDDEEKAANVGVKAVLGTANQFSIDTAVKGSTAVKFTDRAVGSWVARLDGPHKNHMYQHLNVNPKVSGYDPHLWLPKGTNELGQAVGTTLKYANSALFYAAVIGDVVNVADAVKEDVDKGGIERTAEAVGGTAGRWVGAGYGAAWGASLGSVVPVFGTAVGGLVGAMFGGVVGGGLGEGAGHVAAEIVGGNRR